MNFLKKVMRKKWKILGKMSTDATWKDHCKSSTWPIFLSDGLFESPCDASNARTKILLVGCRKKKLCAKIEVFSGVILQRKFFSKFFSQFSSKLAISRCRGFPTCLLDCRFHYFSKSIFKKKIIGVHFLIFKVFFDSLNSLVIIYSLSKLDFLHLSFCPIIFCLQFLKIF